MSASALAAALLLLSLPDAAERRYRVELSGQPVGFAVLRVACGPERCSATWQTVLRAPAAAGGAVLERRVEAETRRDGAALRVRAWVDDGRGQREVEDGSGPAPASLAELLLSGVGAAPACLEVREEASGRTGRACARRDGEWLEAEVLGVLERVRGKPGEPPEEVLVPAQRARFTADQAAALPAEAPALFGVEVPGPPGGKGRRFCGRTAEPVPPSPPAGLPPPRAEGASCREKTARWLEAAAGAGLEGRHVVGVAWDGAAFAWHEWAEVRAGGRWVPVDPSFRQLPAAGTRFAVARFASGDLAAEEEAGRAVLACWGAGAVDP